MSFKYHIDESGFFRADFASPAEVLGWFLEQDIQRSSESCEHMLDICKAIENNKLNEWTGTGNAHMIVLKPTGVFIENEFADQNVTISLEEFKIALKAWRAFLIYKGKNR